MNEFKESLKVKEQKEYDKYKELEVKTLTKEQLKQQEEIMEDVLNELRY